MLKLENVSFLVEDDNLSKTILDNVSLNFEDNKITVITGANGGGKSSLIKVIMGINKASNGKIFLDDKDITNLSITERANLGLTIAFQQPIRFKGLTVKNLLDEASKKNNKVVDACEYLSKVGLCAKNYLNRQLDSTLSGGELKRIEIAMALAKGGKVFLFDEPEAGIDLWSFENLIKIFKNIKNATVIIVSHQKKILEMADNIVLINKNSAPIYGTKDDMLKKLSTPNCYKLGEEDGQ